MKYNNIRAFEKHLIDSAPIHFVDVYLVITKDDFQLKQSVDLLVKHLSQSQSNKGFNIQSFEASQISFDKVLAEFNSFSFFSTKEILHFQNIDKTSKSFLDKLEPALAVPKLPVTLILSASSLLPSTKIYKRIEKVGLILDLPEEKPWNKEKTAQEWLSSLSNQKGKSLSPRTCLFFIKRIGTDYSTLYQELEKLISYVGDRKEILEKDILDIGSVNHTETSWQLGEVIFKHDVANALRISKELLEDDVPFMTLIRQLRSQFETEYQISSILSEGGGVKEIAEQFPKMTPFIIEKHIQQSHSYGFQNFRKALLKIDEIEINFKNSAGDADTLNEFLMVYLSA